MGSFIFFVGRQTPNSEVDLLLLHAKKTESRSSCRPCPTKIRIGPPPCVYKYGEVSCLSHKSSRSLRPACRRCSPLARVLSLRLLFFRACEKESRGDDMLVYEDLLTGLFARLPAIFPCFFLLCFGGGFRFLGRLDSCWDLGRLDLFHRRFQGAAHHIRKKKSFLLTWLGWDSYICN
jgi:hypothetical protein